MYYLFLKMPINQLTLVNFQTSPYLQDLLFEGSSDSAIAIIRITGNLNLANAPLLEDQLADLLHKEYGETENEQPPTILLDLSCVPHIDPSACQCLEEIHISFRKKKQRLHYVGLRGNVWRRMVDMKVFKTVPKDQCYPTLQDALAYLTNRKTTTSNNASYLGLKE